MGNKAQEKNESLIKEEENKDEVNEIINTIIIQEDLAGESKYKIPGKLEFDITFDESKDSHHTIDGHLVTNILIGDTDIYQIDTWQFCLNNVKITKLSCSSLTDDLLYTFTANGFDIK